MQLKHFEWNLELSKCSVNAGGGDSIILITSITTTTASTAITTTTADLHDVQSQSRIMAHSALKRSSLSGLTSFSFCYRKIIFSPLHFKSNGLPYHNS